MSLEFEHITHRFSGSPLGHPVIDDISLNVSSGEIVTLFGPSGCGKTTLLRLAAGHERVQAGAIRLNGKTLADAQHTTSPEDRPVGIVFQDYVLFPHLTVEQNIRFGLNHLDREAQRARTGEQIEGLALTGLEKRFPHELSGGQQQRVAIARALVRKPKALLLDEPFASLGMRLRHSLQEDMRRVLKHNKVAAVFVTHDPDEALTMGDRVALMGQGRILTLATPQLLFTHPTSLEAALLFDRHQLLHGHVENGVLETALGKFSAGDEYAPHVASMMNQVLANSGQVSIVVDSSAIGIEPNEHGAFSVADCRFAGPDWTVFVRPFDRDDAHASLIRCQTPHEQMVSKRIHCHIDARAIKWVSHDRVHP